MNHKHLLAGVAAAAMMVAGNAYAGAHASVEDQVKAQGAAIDALSKEVEALKGASAGVGNGVGGTSLTLSGHVNRAMQYSTVNGRFDAIDNGASNTRFRMIGTHAAGNGLTYTARIEMATGAAGNANDLRNAFVAVGGGFGTLSIGQQSEATDGVLHNAYFLGSLADMNPEHFFGGVSVGAGFDGARTQSIRYATPSFGGAQAAVSYTGGNQDGAIAAQLRYGGNLGGVGVLGAIGYNADGGLDTISGSFGLNFGFLALGVAAGTREDAAGGNDGFYYLSIGHSGNYMDMGSTSLAVDFGSGGIDIAANGFVSNRNTLGLGIVQGMAPGVQGYAAWRHLFDERNNVDFAENVFTVGMRVQF